MRTRRRDRARPFRKERVDRVDQRPAGVDDVVDDEDVPVFHVADDVHDLGLIGADAALVDDGQRRAEALGVRAGALDAAGVGRDDRQILEAEHDSGPSFRPLSFERSLAYSRCVASANHFAAV